MNIPVRDTYTKTQSNVQTTFSRIVTLTTLTVFGIIGVSSFLIAILTSTLQYSTDFRIASTVYGDGTVDSNVKISDGLSGFFPSELSTSDGFGYAVATLGDLNNDDVTDLAVSAVQDENGDSNEGALYILFMNSDGTVDSNVKISDGLSGFAPTGLESQDFFGYAVANIGDLNGDGIVDLAVGATQDENIDTSEGALYILFMNTDGTVDSHVKISDGLSGFNPSNLSGSDNFGSAVTSIGDMDGDGVTDLAIGAQNDENNESGEGALYILFMNSDGTVDSNVKISDGLSGFAPTGLEAGDQFGSAVANIGDLNNDGVRDIAVGAKSDENLENFEGALYILFMNSDGTVDSNVKISDGLSGFFPTDLDGVEQFGNAVANIGDLNGDGVTDLAVGAWGDENSESSEGALYILFMNSDGTVDSNVKISDGLSGFFPSGLEEFDYFGISVTDTDDFNGDGVTDLAVGAFGDENSESAEGALYILFMTSISSGGTVSSPSEAVGGGGGPPLSSYVFDCRDPNALNFNKNLLVIHDVSKCIYKDEPKIISRQNNEITNDTLVPCTPSPIEQTVIDRERTKQQTVSRELTERMKGKLFIQVEEKGEVWYIDNISEKRYYLSDGTRAFCALRTFGLGITNDAIAKIPIGTDDRFTTIDSDGDGLTDELEIAIGTDLENDDTDNDGYSDGLEVSTNHTPNGSGKMTIDGALIEKLKGRILLQVEGRGEAWYVKPENGRRYYLQNGNMAYQIMQFFSVGITNDDLSKIEIGEF